MDEITMKRMEVKNARELETDYSLGLVEYNYGDKLQISWLDIINYVYEQTRVGLGRITIKEKWLREIIDPKIAELQVDLSQIDIDMKQEAAKYNY